jgi:hypothetical protein
MKFKALLLGLLLVSVPAFAAPIDGDWSGSLDTPNGPVMVGYTFKADGTTLTGTTTGPDGAKIAIKNGKIDGNNITFTVDFDMQGTAMSFKYTGVVSADSIALATSFQDMPMTFTVKKTPAAAK